MYINADQAKAMRFRTFTVNIERGRLQFFAKTTGQSDPIYFDFDTARQAGYRDLPVPLTFFPSLELEGLDPAQYLIDLGVSVHHMLHGEQAFTYHSPVCAGDDIRVQPSIVHVETRKGGALEVLKKRTAFDHVDGTPVAEGETTVVILHPEASS